MLFSEVIGQKEIKHRLIDGVNEDRISHALLFSGPEGVGKLAMAIAYAQYINCKNRGETDSCGECTSCKKFKKLIHPDLHFVFPVVKTPKFKDPVSDNFLDKWREQVLRNPYFNVDSWNRNLDVENSQAQIFVNESSEIIRKLNLKTFEAEYKVMIVWMAERMNNQCANKLLKMIEEPPPKTLFILITESEDQILSTIKSRTQLVKFTGIDTESMIQALEKNSLTVGKNCKGMAHLANGNYISALEILSPDEQGKIFFDRFTSLMRLSYKRDWMSLFDWVDEVSGWGREQQKSFLLYCMKMVRENFIMNMKEPDLVFLNEQEKGFSEKFSPFINERNVISFSEEFDRAFRDVSQNGNPRIIFLDLTLTIVKKIRA
jgi:DNA polymerase III subunit delta'